MADHEEKKRKSFSIETILSKDKSKSGKSTRISYGDREQTSIDRENENTEDTESPYTNPVYPSNTEEPDQSHLSYTQQLDKLGIGKTSAFTHKSNKMVTMPTVFNPCTTNDITSNKVDELTVTRPKKKTRTVFSRHQIFYLESAFEMKRYLSSTERSEIASTLNLTETQVKVWFQNRRNKWKSQLNGESNMAEDRFPAFSFNGQYPLSFGALSSRPPNFQLYPHPFMYY